MDTSSARSQSQTEFKPSLGVICRPSKCPLSLELQTTEAKLEKAYVLLAERDAQIASLRKRLEHTEGVLRLREEALFGSRSKQPPASDSPKEPQDASSDPRPPDRKRKRGGQHGHKGHGRKIPEHLPVKERPHEVPPEESVCRLCGQPFLDSGLYEESYEVTMWIELSLIRHVRKREFRGCSCPKTPASVTAPLPPKVIPKSKYSHEFIARTLSWKYGVSGIIKGTNFGR